MMERLKIIEDWLIFIESEIPAWAAAHFGDAATEVTKYKK